jgi:Tol biopolymer transport system component
VWSPDSKKIAFDTDRGDADPNNDPAINDIFTMNTDGSGLRNLTGSTGFSADAGWSPDSKTIAFDSDRGDYPAKQGIYVMRADGSHVRRVTTLPAGQANDLAPRFSPTAGTSCSPVTELEISATLRCSLSTSSDITSIS